MSSERIRNFRTYSRHAGRFLLLLCVFSGCSFNPYRPVSGELSHQELIGEWKFDKESVEWLSRENDAYRNKQTSLTLDGDGSFVLQNMPDCWIRDFGECGGNNFSYRGEWSINKWPNTNVWRLHFNYKEGAYSKTHSIPLILRKGRMQIAFVFGDPDMGREVYMSKN